MNTRAYRPYKFDGKHHRPCISGQHTFITTCRSATCESTRNCIHHLNVKVGATTPTTYLAIKPLWKSTSNGQKSVDWFRCPARIFDTRVVSSSEPTSTARFHTLRSLKWKKNEHCLSLALFYRFPANQISWEGILKWALSMYFFEIKYLIDFR